MDADRLRERARDALFRVRTELGMYPPAPPSGTPRDQLLALAELTRRRTSNGDGEEPDLTGHELRVLSQNGEDGVLAEIARRSGTPGRSFVEFGASDGVESNCALLAEQGWSGLFIEGDDAAFGRLADRYVGRPLVRTAQAMVTPANVEALFEAHGVPAEPDVLSIDVDGSDYWIWAALDAFRPRIVVIEYNGVLPPGRRLVQPRDTGPWRETDFYGASIEALVGLGRDKGYRLVHCDLTGNNAFFVRDDLPGTYLEPDAVPRRRANFWLAGQQHRPDPDGRSYVDLDAQSARAQP